MDYFKNPIILGLLASGISYSYLKFKEYQENKNKDDSDKEYNTDMMYPILFGLIVFFGVTIWLQYDKKKLPLQLKPNVHVPAILESSSQIITNFKDLGKALPHVFIETS